MTKINTHKLLSSYHGQHNYPQIAQTAVKLAKNGINEQGILDAISVLFEQTHKMTMKQRPGTYTIYGEHLIEDSAVKQFETALSIPPSIRGALMPDSHLGYALPIGGVIDLDNAISPSFVGFDISCMMYLTIFDLNVTGFENNQNFYSDILRNVTRFGKGANFERNERQHSVMDDSLWSTAPLKQYKELAQIQLGSSGGGNHFADLVQVNDRIGLLTHSGSRGTGHKLATYYCKLAKEYTDTIATDIPSGYEWLSMDTVEGQEYHNVMMLLKNYAVANHELIHNHFMTQASVKSIFTVNNQHNLAWFDPKTRIVRHRKGATPASYNTLGVIPGSSGTNSYVVRGLGNVDSLDSASHGAGRVGSRTQAKKDFNKSAFDNHMQGANIQHFGLAKDESYQAYKNIDAVMNAQQENVESLLTLKPKVVIMASEDSDDGD